MYSERYRRGITELLEILKNNDQEYTDKIPEKLLNFLEKNASKDYKIEFDKDKELKDLNLQKETKAFLSMLFLYYWCDEKDREDFLKILKDHIQ